MRITTQSIDTFKTIVDEGRMKTIYATTLVMDAQLSDKVVRRIMVGYSMSDKIGTIILYSEQIGEWDVKDITDALVKDIDKKIAERKEVMRQHTGVRILDGVIE